MRIRNWIDRSKAEPAQAAASAPKAFEEVVSAHLDALYRTARRLCAGNAADAEDLLQDSMLRALQRYAELRNPAAAKYWLFTILVRTNLNRMRTQRRRGKTLASDLSQTEFEAALEAWHPSESPEEILERRRSRPT